MKELFTQEFWQTLLETVTGWLVNSLPPIILILILALISLRFLKIGLRKVQSVIVHRAEKDPEKEAAETEKRARTLTSILRVSGKIAIWTIFGMILLGKLGVNIGPLIAGAGIVGLAVGFGSQELVRDMISGFFMLMENQIRTGDVAVINGTGGLVESIGIRTVTLRDLSGVVHVFQNGKINSLSNMTKKWSAMVFDIGVAYKENTDEVTRIIREVGEEMANDPGYRDHITEPIEIFGVDQFGDSAVVIKARIKTKPIQQWTVGREFRRRLKHAFDKSGIEIPFPHTTVYWGEKIDELDVRLSDARESKAVK